MRDGFREAEQLANALNARRLPGGGWMARCPVHDDHTPSLKIDGSPDRILVHCHAGCDQSQVIETLQQMHAWPEPEPEETKPPAKPEIAATYDYVDEEDNLLYQVVRFRPKDFRQRRPRVPNPQEPSDWEWGLGTTRRVLYRLPQIVQANPERPIFVVEGEKDADRLTAEGLLATTAPMGAKKWRNEYSESLRDRTVVVLADNDEPGKMHAKMVAKSLRGVAKDVQILSFKSLPPGGDVSDWLDGGGSREALLNWVAKNAMQRARVQVPRDKPISSPDLLSLELPPIRYAVHGVLPEGATVWVAKAKMGKTIGAMDIGLAVGFGGVAFGRLRAEKGTVLYLALEDNPRRLQSRLERMLHDAAPPPNLYFVLQWPRVGEGCIEQLREWIEAHPDTLLIVIDTLTMVRGKPDGQQSVYDRDYESVQLFHELAQEYQVAILIIYHTRKAESDDPFDLISGSTGLSAAADTLWVMQRKRGENDAVLTVGGREIETTDLAMTFDPNLFGWVYEGDAEEFLLSKERQEIVDAITRAGTPLSVKEISETLEKNFYTTKNLVTKMAREDVLKHLPGRGYTLGDASSLKVLSGENRKNRSPRSLSGDLPHEDAKNEDYAAIESRSPGVVHRSLLPDTDELSKTTEDYGKTTANSASVVHQFWRPDGENEAKDYEDYGTLIREDSEDEELLF